MQITIDSSGPRSSVVADVSGQCANAVANLSNATYLAEGVLYAVAQELKGVPDDATITVHISLSVDVMKPPVAAH